MQVTALRSGSEKEGSIYRIKRKLVRIPPQERRKKYLERLSNLAAHKFSRQLGLDHCPENGCIMEDAGGTVLTFDRSNGRLCCRCRKTLVAKGYLPPAGDG